MNSDDIKQVLDWANEIFPIPEGVLGAHGLVLHKGFPVDGGLELSIRVAAGHIPLVFDPGEEITKELLIRNKKYLDENPNSTEWTYQPGVE